MRGSEEEADNRRSEREAEMDTERGENGGRLTHTYFMSL